jgi:hypothetical protein
MLAALICLRWEGLGAEPGPSLAGSYRDEQMVLELKQQSGSSRSGESYTGTIQLGDQKFPLKAESEENRLKGSFESQGAQFEFSASVVGRMLVLTTDGTTYRLTKDSGNPLARTVAKPNPLARPRTNAAPVTTAPARTVAPPPVSTTGTLRFVRQSVMDDPAMIGGEAFSLLIPADWQIEGGLAWRIHPSVPAYVSMRVASPDRAEALEAFPALMFVWAEGGIPLRPPGSQYLGNEVAEPMEDPILYVKQVLLPRFRKNLPITQITGSEELPKVAEAISENSQEPGLQKKFRAARVRLEYLENGRLMQEDIYCVLASAYAPAIRTTLWGPDRNYSFKAEKGKLDGRSKVFQTVIGSLRPSLPWFNRYLQLLQVLGRSQIETVRHVSEFGPCIKTATTDRVTDALRQVYQLQQTAQERVNASFLTYLRGLEDYRSPIDKRRVVLPAYPGVWANARGDYLLAEDSSYDPNAGSTTDWQRVNVNR